MPVSDKVIRRLIELSLGVKGGKEAERVISDILTQTKLLIAANPALANSVEDVSREVNKLGATYRRNNTLFLKYAKEEETALKKISGAFVSIRDAAKAALGPINSLAAMVGGESIGFGSGYKYLMNYDKELIKVSSQFAKYNKGIGEVEKSILKMQKATGLTRKESMQLLSVYEKGFPYASMEKGVKLLENIKKATGGDAQAMQEYLNVISSVIEKYPELEEAAENLDEADRARLENANQLAVLNGKMSLAEYKRFQDYLNGTQKQKSADEQRRDAIQSEIDAMNSLRQSFEQIALEIGKVVNQYLKPMAEAIKSMLPSIVSWIGPLTKVALLFEAISMSARGLKTLNSVGKAVGKFAGIRGGSGLGLAGQIGGGVVGGVAGGAVYDLGYQAVTGHAMDEAGRGGNMSYLAGMGRAGTRMAAAAKMGGIPGAIAGGVISIGQDTWESGKVGTDIYHASRAAMAVNKHTDRINSAIAFGTDVDAAEARKRGNLKDAALFERQAAAERMRRQGMDLDAKSRGTFWDDTSGIAKAKKMMADAQKEMIAISLSRGERTMGAGGQAVATNADEKKAIEAEEKKRQEVAKTNEEHMKQVALMNEQRMRTDETNHLLEAQKGELSAIVAQMAQTGKIDEKAVSEGIDSAVASLKQYNSGLKEQMQLRQQLLQVELQSQDAAIAKKQAEIDAEKDPEKKAQLTRDKQEMEIRKRASVLQLQTETEQSKARTSTRTQTKQILDIINSTLDVNKANTEAAAAQANKTQALVNLYDNLGLGLAASAKMRMDAAKSIGSQVNQEKKNLDIINERIAKAKELGLTDDQLTDLQNKRVEKETQILNLQQQQAATLKTLRDGYISAITAMTAGTGMFSKVMIDQNKNLGVAVKYLGITKSMRSGGSELNRSVGGRDKVEFSAGGGITGQTAAGSSAMWNTYNGGGSIAGDVQSMQAGLQKEMERASNASGEAAAIGGNPYYAGAKAATPKYPSTMPSSTGPRSINNTIAGTMRTPEPPNTPSSGGGSQVVAQVKLSIDNINVTMDDIQQLPNLVRNEIEKKMKAELGDGLTTSLQAGMNYL